MKIYIYFLVIILSYMYINTSNAQQIMNGGFEDVYNDTSENPNGVITPLFWWFGWNPQDCGIPLGKLSTNSYNGDWAIELETISCWWGNNAGTVSTWSQTPNAMTYPEVASHQIDARPDQLSFHYKYLPMQGDSSRVIALLFNYPEGITINDPNLFSYIDTVGLIDYAIIDSTEGYINETLNFQYLSTSIPSYIKLTFMSSLLFYDHGHPGTTLWIDDVELIYLTTSVENLITSTDVKLYPNPVEESFRIDVPGNTQIQSITVFDYSGRVVKNLVPQNGLYSINWLSSGIYFVQIETDKGNVVKKVMKE
jgi:hypothetical protein